MSANLNDGPTTGPNNAIEPEVLLQLQSVDLAIGAAKYRIDHHPTVAGITQLNAEIAKAESGVAPQRESLRLLSERQNNLELRVVALDEKIGGVTKSLYSGTTTASRELQALETDIALLKKHRSELEDEELGVLLEKEPLEADVALVDVAIGKLIAQRTELEASAAGDKASLVSEISELSLRRTELVGSIPPEIITLYEKVRSANRGLGAAKLEHGTCMACRLKLPAMEIDRIRKLAAGELVRCEQCGAILIRP